MSGHSLPLVCAAEDVNPEAVARVHKSLRKLPAHLAATFIAQRVGIFIRSDFSWDGGNMFGAPWGDCGGYWDSGTRYGVINAAWCKRQNLMDAVVIHELGHALSIDVLEKPYRTAAFREAWSLGRAEVARRWPAEYRAKRGMGVYCIHWTNAVAEVWADSFCWILGTRRTIHTAFGSVFAECVELVRPHVVLSI